MKVKIALILSVIFMIAAADVHAQKASNYFFGKAGTNTYQHYSFWSANGKPTEITFTGGANRTESKVTYNGKATYQGKTCFKMTRANGKVFYVYPIGLKLAIVNATTKKIETFTWEYEGPVNGVGTFCNVCAQDEKEAMTLLKAAYLK